MFALAFEAISQFIIGCIIIYGGYRFIFRNSLNKEEEVKTAKNAAVKLAIVKLHSNDYKDIENFLNKNAQYLPIDTVEKLASHLENIKIFNNDPLEKKFENLEARQRIAPGCIDCGTITPSNWDRCVTCESIQSFVNDPKHINNL